MGKARRKIALRPVWGSILYWIQVLILFGFIRLYGLEEDGLYQLTQPQLPLGLIVVAQGTGMGLLIGLIYGILDQVFSLGRFRKLSYAWIVLIRTGIHLGVVALLIFVSIFFTLLFYGSAPANYALEILGEAMTHTTLVLVLIYTALFSFIFNTFRQITVMFGPGILLKIMLGRYHRPQEEERIFMFLDLRSSTTYGEQLGHVLYSQLIQDCFHDLTDAIIQHQAEIYQYVGDEVVLSWPTSLGLKDSNCLWVYFSFMETIRRRVAYYAQKYDMVPEFKAGVNLGKVMVAEVGVIKKEIAFHSDVLNTAARIQGKCNQLGKSLLVSPMLIEAIQDWDGLHYQEVGNVHLKGKAKDILIYSVEKESMPEPEKQTSH